MLQLYVLLDQKIIGMVSWQTLSKHKGKGAIKEFIETDFQYISTNDFILKYGRKCCNLE